ncbi:hypothetical protein GOP47_0028313 [Adiantum capillus-veneris]|nr:hypothetical protein GOP47_0028313 [Adiantum capillus-veneris]
MAVPSPSSLLALADYQPPPPLACCSTAGEGVEGSTRDRPAIELRWPPGTLRQANSSLQICGWDNTDSR